MFSSGALADFSVAARAMCDSFPELEGGRYLLMAAVLVQPFLVVQGAGHEDRRVLDREQYRVLGGRGIGVLVHGPGRDCQNAALVPVERLAIDHGRALALDHAIDAAARMPVGLQALSRPDELHRAGDRRQAGAAGLRIGVVQPDAVVRIALLIARREQGLARVRPGVEPQWRVGLALL